MKVISFVASKGGVGKSTLAVNCAVAALKQGNKVFLYDMDEQQTAAAWFERRPDGGWGWDEGCEPDLIVPEALSCRINEAVEHARATGADIVILDTPGRDTPGIASAMRLSDLVLIPSRPAFEDLRTLRTTVDTARRLNKSFAFILTQTPAVTAAKGGRVREAIASLSRLGALAPQPIVNRIAYQDAQGLGLGVVEYEPDGKAAHEINRLWDWIIKTINERDGKAASLSVDEMPFPDTRYKGGRMFGCYWCG